MKRVKKDARYLYCCVCGKPIKTGQGWVHRAKEELDYHLKCYLGDGRSTGEVKARWNK